MDPLFNYSGGIHGNGTFVCVINYLVLRVITTGKTSIQECMVLCVVFSFGVFHQYILLFYVPVLIYLVIKYRSYLLDELF